MIYIILGMHKSGTTMLSEILHKSGINMGDFDLSIDYYNGQKYEREDTSHAIWDILDCREKHSLDTLPPFNEQIIRRHLPELVQLIKKYDNKYDKWGFKEPRSVFVYPYLKDQINDHKLICVYRDPFDVVLHYLQFFKYDLKRVLKSLKAWKAHNEEMVTIIESSKQELILFNYRSFVKEIDSIDKLSDFVGVDLIDVRKPKKKKKKFEKMIHHALANFLLSLNFYNWKSTQKKLDLLYEKFEKDRRESQYALNS